MPLPFIIGAAVLGTAALGVFMHCSAQEKINKAEEINNENKALTLKDEAKTQKVLQQYNSLRADIGNDFQTFADLVEQIHNRPEFAHLKKIEVPSFSDVKLDNIDTSFPALAVASGVALASSCAVVAGVASSGLFLLGGVALSITGFLRSNDADKLLEQVLINKEKVEKNLQYSEELRKHMLTYIQLLQKMQSLYKVYLQKLQAVVDRNYDYEKFSGELKTEIDDCIFSNTAFLTSLIFDMCKKPLLLKADNAESEDCQISYAFNHKEIDYMSRKAKYVSFLTKNPDKGAKAKNKLALFYAFEGGRWTICHLKESFKRMRK